MNFVELENNIGYKFQNINLLKNALTHTSYANENNVVNYEKLEYLGDSILEFVISKYLYNNFNRLKEGEMTKVRASVVCEESLYKIAIKHNFSDFLFLGKSEITNSKNRQAILADIVEAVIAAIFLDSNIDNAEKFIIENLADAVECESKDVGQKDYKTVLQEKLQKNGNIVIEYKIIKEEGPDHNKKFTAQVGCNGKVLGIGEGKSKKLAEMQAAKVALDGKAE